MSLLTAKYFNFMNANQNIFYGDKGWLETISSEGIFEEKITQWIKDYRNGSLFKEDVLNVTKKFAEYRNTLSLIEEIRQRLN